MSKVKLINTRIYSKTGRYNNCRILIELENRFYPFPGINNAEYAVEKGLEYFEYYRVTKEDYE